MYDVVIKNANVIDGTGASAYQADVAVCNGKIVRISEEINEKAREIIEAKGLTLTPGFIDSHSHDDLIMETVPTLYHKLEQGVTTVITGMCGFSASPVSERYTEEGYRLYDTIAASGTVKEQCTRSDFRKYIENLRNGFGTNVAFHVGHNTIRTAVMGFANRKPDEKEMEMMKDYVREAMENGALGISFGLFYNPGKFADTDECIELCKVVREYDGDMTVHIRNENIHVVEAVKEVLGIVRATGIRCVISHHKCTGDAWGYCQKTIPLIEEANREGYCVYLDQYPYNAFSTGLNSEIPDRYVSLPKDELLNLMSDPAKAKEMADEMDRINSKGYFDKLMVGGSVNCPEYSGRMIKDIAASLNRSEAETILDILLKDELSTSEIGFCISEDDIEYIMKYPRTMVGTDGLWYPEAQSAHPRAFASFPRVLGYYVNEKHVISLNEAIRRMTSLPAWFYGLENKGLIKEGYDADMCLFDAEKIKDMADYVNFDARCQGLKHVFVKGEITVTDSLCNGRLVGEKLLRNRKQNL